MGQADAGSIKLKDSAIVLNVDTKNLTELQKTLNNIAKGSDLQTYWQNAETAIQNATKALKKFQQNESDINASNLIKQINALKAMFEGQDIKSFVPDFNVDDLLSKAKQIQPKINDLFSEKNFKQAFTTFKTLEDAGINLMDVFSSLSKYQKLSEDFRKTRDENYDFKRLFGDDADAATIKQQIDQMQKLRSEARNTFQSFLDINNINGYDYQFRDYFDQIQRGTLTAKEAIQQFKSEYSYLLRENETANVSSSLGLQEFQEFSNKLEQIFLQVQETATKINDIVANGVVAKTLQDINISDSVQKVDTKNILDPESFKSIEPILSNIESHLQSIKSVLVDVGDGEEFSPLLQTIKNVESAVQSLGTAIKGIGFNLNIDVENSSNAELENKLQGNISKALSAYQQLYDQMRLQNVGDDILFQQLWDFDVDKQFDTAIQKIEAYRSLFKNLKTDYLNRHNLPDTDEYNPFQRVDKSYFNQAIAAYAGITRVQNEIKKTSQSSNGLQDLFGNKAELTEIISSLNQIVIKLDEISKSAIELKTAFSGGLKVEAATADITELTNKVKELEGELSKLKVTPTASTGTGNTTEKVKSSTEKVKQEAKETAETIQNLDFTPNTESFNEIVEKFEYLKQYADLIEKITKTSKQTPNGYAVSYNAKLKNGTSVELGENSTPQMLRASEVAYNAKETEKAEKQKQAAYQQTIKVLQEESAERKKESESNRQSTVSQALKDQLFAYKQIQSIRGKIANTNDENLIAELNSQKSVYQEQYLSATKILKANSDLYDSEKRLNDMLQIGLTTSQKIAEVKIKSNAKETEKAEKQKQAAYQQTIKVLQEESAERKKESESNRQSTVSQALKDQLFAYKQIQSIRGKIANTNDENLIAELNSQKSVYQEQYLSATKILKANSDLYDSEKRLNDMLQIGLTTSQKIAEVKIKSNAKETEKAEKEADQARQRYLKEQQDNWDTAAYQQQLEYSEQLEQKEAEYQAKKKQYAKEGKQQEKEVYQARQRYLKEQQDNWDAAYKDKAKSDKDKAAQEAALQAKIYRDLINAISDYSKVSKRISGGNALDTDITKAEELEDQISVLQKSPVLSNEQIQQSERLLGNLFDELDVIGKKVQSTSQKAATSSLKKLVQSQSLDVLKLGNKLHEREAKPEQNSQSQKYQNILNEMRSAYSEIQSLQQKIQNDANNELAPSEAALSKFTELKQKIQDCEQSFKDLTAAEKGSTSLSRDKLNNQISEYLNKNSGMSKEYKQALKDIQDKLNLRETSANVSDLKDEFLQLQVRIREAGQEGRSLLDVIKDKAWYGFASQIAMYFSFNDWVRYIRNGISAVIELDDALIDLKKTTTMNSGELNQFYYDANNVAKQMGVTTKEIIEQASAWSRLGYSTQAEATKMAELSSKFASISPGMTTDEAQNDLVSIMKAYDIDPDDVETEIMDKINVLGNKFAENNQDVAEGLKRSAAAMAAMGQSFTDTAALFTGGMEILQDAESMGTALRTLSMRIRGYDEETEELSDDLVNVTGDVADLTKTTKDAQGVSLFTDASQEHYKSMVDYLGEIAERWDDISEKNQTELLQKLFGKNRANAGAAILKNFDQVRAAIKEMDDSAGSSEAEMSTIEQSISYHLNELKQTWVGTAQVLADRGSINTVISGLTSVSEVIQSIVKYCGLLPTLITTIGTGLSAVSNVGRGKMYPLMFKLPTTHYLFWIQNFRMC